MKLDAAYAIINLEEAKEYLKVKDSENDEIIHALLNGIGSWISGFLGRNLVSTEFTEYYNGDGTDVLILKNSPVTALTSLKIDSLRVFDSSTEVSASDIIIQKGTGIIKAFNLTVFPCGFANIKVVYTAGYTTDFDTSVNTMPHAIKMAAKRILDHQWRSGYTHRKLDVASESVGNVNTSFRPLDIPQDAQSMLLPYRNLIQSPNFSHGD